MRENFLFNKNSKVITWKEHKEKKQLLSASLNLEKPFNLSMKIKEYKNNNNKDDNGDIQFNNNNWISKSKVLNSLKLWPFITGLLKTKHNHSLNINNIANLSVTFVSSFSSENNKKVVFLMPPTSVVNSQSNELFLIIINRKLVLL
jgi:hypothetical protein